MPTPGPWIQPADVVRAASRSIFGGDDRPMSTSIISRSATGWASLVGGGTFIVAEEDPTVAEINTTLSKAVHLGVNTWSGSETLLLPWPGTISLAPVPPTPAELAQPHVVGYEYEGGPGALSVLLQPVAMSYYLPAGDVLFDSNPPIDPLTVIRTAVFELLAGDYTTTATVLGGPQIHAAAWLSTVDLDARTLIAVDDMGTAGAPGSPQLPFLGGAASWSVDTSGGTPAYAIVLEQLWTGPDLAPDFNGDPLYSVRLLTTGEFAMEAAVHPPRYRLLYDYVPQRQYPRDDGLAISTKRTYPQPTSLQFSLRRGPAGTYQ